MSTSFHQDNKKNIFSFQALRSKKVLTKLTEILDEFYKDPERFERAKLEGILKEFFRELSIIFSDWTTIQKLIEKEILKAGTRLSPIESILGFFWNARKALENADVDDYGCDREFEEAIKPIFDFLYFKYFRVQTLGVENIPTSGSALLVSNHSGVLPYDGSMVKMAVYNEQAQKREVRLLVDDFVFHFPFLGTFMNRVGGVRACPENAERLLSHGELLAVFPEGIKGIGKPFKDRYKLQRFGRGGVIRLALKTKAPIIPVAVIGAEEIHPLIYKSAFLARPLGLPWIPMTPFFPFLGPLGMIPLPTKWTIVFGKPIPYDWATPRDINDGILINRKTEELRSEIQAMLDEQLKKRESIFFG